LKNILVATDFSERSDRALRRATFLAREFSASVTMVHSVDDDQPRSLVDNQQEIAEKLLAKQARSLQETDGIACSYEVVLGDPFEGIAAAAKASSPDLLVIGPHRRQVLKDVFTGTTAERIVRTSRAPVLMANGVPAGPYRHILVAVDMSDSSANAVEAVKRMGLDSHAHVTVLYVFDAPGVGLIVNSSAADESVGLYTEGERKAAERALAAFLKHVGFEPDFQILRFNETSVGDVVIATADELSADLVVIGTHGRTGLSRLMLGSVADVVLRRSNRDVLAVPPGGAD